MTVVLRLSSNLDFGRTHDRLSRLHEVKVEQSTDLSKLTVRFKKNYRTSLQIWSGGGVAVYVQPCENLRDFLQPLLDAMVDKHSRPASKSLKTFETKGSTGTGLLWALVTYDWMGFTDDDRRRYHEMVWWAQDTCELALAAFGRSAGSDTLTVQLETPVEA